MKRIILVFFIISTLIISVCNYFSVEKASYNKYLSGEYYFREKAYTVYKGNENSYLADPEILNKDYTDPGNMLSITQNVGVYVEKPHNGLCTVYYGSSVIEDYPISRLRFENDDEDYFYGKKKYTYKEYVEYVKSLSDSQLDSFRVSDRKMANFTKVKEYMYILFGVDIVFGIILFVLYRSESEFLFNLTLLICCLYSVFFEVVTFFALSR